MDVIFYYRVRFLFFFFDYFTAYGSYIQSQSFGRRAQLIRAIVTKYR